MSEQVLKVYLGILVF